MFSTFGIYSFRLGNIIYLSTTYFFITDFLIHIETSLFQSKAMDWCLYDSDLVRESVKVMI